MAKSKHSLIPSDENQKTNSEALKNRAISIIIPVISLVVSVVLFKTVFFLGFVPTASMTPKYKEKSFCFGMRVGTTYEVGDVITFYHDGQVLLKRIAAKGGETYECDGVKFEVPEGCFFMRGDNVDNSYDSRYWDNPYVSENDVVAEIILPRG